MIMNGSLSPVLTATSLSYGEAKNLTPHRIKTPDWIKIKSGMVDSARGPVVQIFMQIPPRGLLGKWVKYTQKFLFIYVFFFFNAPTGQTF